MPCFRQACNSRGALVRCSPAAMSGLGCKSAVLLCVLLNAVNSLSGMSPTIEFNRDIRPIFSDRCFTCHGPDAATRKTKMRLDMESTAKVELRGGRRSIVPGNPDASEIYRRISSDDKAVRMPPAYMGKEKLTPREIALIRDWIAQGATWEPFWSFIPPKRAAAPRVKDSTWVRNPIDAFILSRLE